MINVARLPGGPTIIHTLLTCIQGLFHLGLVT
jgi:hypothetical protein